MIQNNEQSEKSVDKQVWKKTHEKMQAEKAFFLSELEKYYFWQLFFEYNHYTYKSFFLCKEHKLKTEKLAEEVFYTESSVKVKLTY